VRAAEGEHFVACDQLLWWYGGAVLSLVRHECVVARLAGCASKGVLGAPERATSRWICDIKEGQTRWSLRAKVRPPMRHQRHPARV
jgi:hypothetical protein